MIEVLAPGLLTTVQDLGRPGFRHLGVPSGGAADADALAVANRLVGNAPGAAGLEITLSGPTLKLRRDTVFALAGAEIELDLDGSALPTRTPVFAGSGSVLRIGRVRDGARAMLAVRGGIAVAPCLGSRSTALRAGFGGLEGRALRAGDRLRVLPSAPALADALRARAARDGRAHALAPFRAATLDDLRGPVQLLHVLDGLDAAILDRAAVRAATQGEWLVAPDSDRMGVRFSGVTLALAERREKISLPVFPGTVQLPPDGRPIVLGVDAQTTGGYPCIAHVMRADLGLLMQLRPGERVRIVRVTRGAADAAWRTRRTMLARMAEGIRASHARLLAGSR